MHYKFKTNITYQSRVNRRDSKITRSVEWMTPLRLRKQHPEMNGVVVTLSTTVDPDLSSGRFSGMNLGGYAGRYNAREGVLYPGQGRYDGGSEAMCLYLENILDELSYILTVKKSLQLTEALGIIGYSGVSKSYASYYKQWDEVVGFGAIPVQFDHSNSSRVPLAHRFTPGAQLADAVLMLIDKIEWEKNKGRNQFKTNTGAITGSKNLSATIDGHHYQNDVNIYGVVNNGQYTIVPAIPGTETGSNIVSLVNNRGNVSEFFLTDTVTSENFYQETKDEVQYVMHNLLKEFFPESIYNTFVTGNSLYTYTVNQAGGEGDVLVDLDGYAPYSLMNVVGFQGSDSTRKDDYYTGRQTTSLQITGTPQSGYNLFSSSGLNKPEEHVPHFLSAEKIISWASISHKTVSTPSPAYSLYSGSQYNYLAGWSENGEGDLEFSSTVHFYILRGNNADEVSVVRVKFEDEQSVDVTLPTTVDGVVNYQDGNCDISITTTMYLNRLRSEIVIVRSETTEDYLFPYAADDPNDVRKITCQLFVGENEYAPVPTSNWSNVLCVKRKMRFEQEIIYDEVQPDGYEDYVYPACTVKYTLSGLLENTFQRDSAIAAANLSIRWWDTSVEKRSLEDWDDYYTDEIVLTARHFEPTNEFPVFAATAEFFKLYDYGSTTVNFNSEEDDDDDDEEEDVASVCEDHDGVMYTALAQKDETGQWVEIRKFKSDIHHPYVLTQLQNEGYGVIYHSSESSSLYVITQNLVNKLYYLRESKNYGKEWGTPMLMPFRSGFKSVRGHAMQDGGHVAVGLKKDGSVWFSRSSDGVNWKPLVYVTTNTDIKGADVYQMNLSGSSQIVITDGSSFMVGSKDFGATWEPTDVT